MQKIILILVASNLIALCSYSQNILSDEERLRKIEDIWHQTYVNKNPKPLDTILADNFIHINGRGGRNFKTEEIKSVTDDPSVYQLCYPYDLEIKVFGDNALIIGKTHEKGKSGDKEFEGFYFWTDYFVKRNGIWQCILAQTAPLPQARFNFGNNLSLKDSALTRETLNFINGLVKQDKFSGVVIILKNDSTIYRGLSAMLLKNSTHLIHFQQLSI